MLTLIISKLVIHSSNPHNHSRQHFFPAHENLSKGETQCFVCWQLSNHSWKNAGSLQGIVLNMSLTGRKFAQIQHLKVLNYFHPQRKEISADGPCSIALWYCTVITAQQLFVQESCKKQISPIFCSQNAATMIFECTLSTTNPEISYLLAVFVRRQSLQKPKDTCINPS